MRCSSSSTLALSWGISSLASLPELLVAFAQHLLGLVELAARHLVLPEGLDEGREIGVLLGQLLVLGAVGDHGGIAQEPLQLLVSLFNVLDTLKHVYRFRFFVMADEGGAAFGAARARKDTVSVR